MKINQKLTAERSRRIRFWTFSIWRLFRHYPRESGNGLNAKLVRFFPLLLLLIAPGLRAQTTLVSGAITDSGAQAWTNGTYSFTFLPSPSNPTGNYFQNGVAFNKNQVISGSLDGTGSLTSIAVPDNKTITPAGSQWTVQVCPAATQTNGCFLVNLTITGASQSITSSVVPPPVQVNMQAAPFYSAYQDSEIFGARVGQSYFNLTTGNVRACAFPACAWTNVGGVGGSGTVSCTTSGGIGFGTTPNTMGCSPNLTYNSGNQSTSLVGGTGSGNFIGAPTESLISVPSNTPFNIFFHNTNAPSSSGMGVAAQNDGTVALFSSPDGTVMNQMTLAFDDSGTIIATAPNGAEFNTQFCISSDNVNSFCQTATAGTSANQAVWPGMTGLNGQLLKTNGANPQLFSWGFVLSGMTAGQVPIAATATTSTSSKAIQGTDANLLSSGTISGTGVSLCTDANGGATTSGCPATGAITAVDQVGQSAAIGATTILTCPASPATGTNYLLSSNLKITTVASGSSTLGPLSVTYQTPDGTTFTNLPVAYRIAPSGASINTAGDTSNVTTSFDVGLPFLVNCKAGTSITYVMGYASVGVTVMVYDLHVRLIQQ